MIDVSDLLPCPNPWCPTDSRRIIVWDLYRKRVICTCGVKGPKSETMADKNQDGINIFNSKEPQAIAEAITAWNTRPTLPDESWQLIDTAKPNDLDKALLLSDGDPIVGIWLDGPEQWFDDTTMTLVDNLTHWHPLPAKPTTTPEKG